MDLFAEEGYSASERKQFLSSVLTELTEDATRRQGGRGGALMDEVRNILEDEQAKHDSVPMAKDSS